MNNESSWDGNGRYSPGELLIMSFDKEVLKPAPGI
jgi:hypothetical protein